MAFKPRGAWCIKQDWNLSTDDGKSVTNAEHAILAVSMDIRDELQKLNRVLACRNFQNIPKYLREIRRFTYHKKKLSKSDLKFLRSP